MNPFWTLDFGFSIGIPKSEKVLYFAPVAVLMTLNLLVEAQHQTKMPKVGWLAARSASAIGPELFTKELRALGYVEGKNISFEYRFADDKVDRLPALADELLRLKPDVLVTPSFTAALVLKNATKTIPIVFLGVADPVTLGLLIASPTRGATSRDSLIFSRRWRENDG